MLVRLVHNSERDEIMIPNEKHKNIVDLCCVASICTPRNMMCDSISFVYVSSFFADGCADFITK